MDKKNLAKSALAALLLTAGAGAVQAEAAAFSNEATTFLAVAGCPGGGWNNNAPQRRSGGNSQYNYTADDTNNPYANPATPNQPGAMGGGSYSSDGQQPYGSGYGSNRGMQSSQQGSMSGGGGAYGSSNMSNANPSWSNDPNNPNNPNNPRMGGGSNPNNPANQPSNTWNMNR